MPTPSSGDSPRVERVLAWLLRLAGAVLLLALPAALLPRAWMASAHALLGLGELPRGPIVDYLARSASLLYAMHGAILIACSMDVRRNAALIRIVGLVTVVFGAGIVAVDLAAGMPWWWTSVEGGPTATMGAIIAGLAARLVRRMS